jgi:hypothetical protein
MYIAALADPSASEGTGAENWGLWRTDPGPIGVRLPYFDAMMEAGGYGPTGWQLDLNDWWLDENGILMKAPDFPMPPSQFYVTNGEGSYSLLTVEQPDEAGRQAWRLSRLTIADVTHGPCRAGRYRPTAGQGSCTPASVSDDQFPLPLGAEPPTVENCDMVEYEVLIIFGVPAPDPNA